MPQELYEEILRNAFSYITKNHIDRYGDPAKLADTDMYYLGNIDRVKIGLGYAMEILFSELREDVDDNEINRFNGFSHRLIQSQTLNDIEAIMNDFNTTVFQIYYNMEKGVISRV